MVLAVKQQAREGVVYALVCSVVPKFGQAACVPVVTLGSSSAVRIRDLMRGFGRVVAASNAGSGRSR
jgi:hypothetical protein